MINTF